MVPILPKGLHTLWCVPHLKESRASQGLYESIRDASSLQRPIYITETGCADRTGRYRRQMIESHCGMVAKSIADG